MKIVDAAKVNKVLFIRRDNIGDLICTTPAIYALRERYPSAEVGILVNSYNADVVENNRDVDKIYIYEKTKHAEERSRTSVLFNNLKLLLRIRKERYDIAVGCGYGYSKSLKKYTVLTGARKRIGYVPGSQKSFYYNIPISAPSEPVHEVVATFRLLEPLGITGEPQGLVLSPSADEQSEVLRYLKSIIPDPASRAPYPVFAAIHISSRKENNRWSADRFVELGNQLIKKYNVRPLILWAPGSIKNPFYPGDDEKAYEIAGTVKGAVLYKTTRLRELIAAISVCSMVVCCDGGAMHIAAALGKPILTIWGSTDKKRWAPWKTESIVLQKGLRADEITVEEALAAFERMWSNIEVSA